MYYQWLAKCAQISQQNNKQEIFHNIYHANRQNLINKVIFKMLLQTQTKLAYQIFQLCKSFSKAD